MRWIIRALVLILAVTAPVLAFRGEKQVRVDIEGDVLRVNTYASSGHELLERIGFEPGDEDVVEPMASLEPGDTVKLRRGKAVHVWIDGKPRPVMAHGLTVGEAVSELGYEVDESDYLAPPPAAPVVEGMSVVLRNAVYVKVDVDGRSRDVVSSAKSVRDLLAQADISLGPEDFVRPTLGTRPTKGMAIRVVRADRVVTTERVRIPFTLIERKDPSLDRGERRVVQEGAEGIKIRRYSTYYEDGEAVSRRLISEEVTQEPRPRVVRVGTRGPAYSGRGHSNSGIASWFHADGFVAAHRTLPLGTVVKVTDVQTGKSVTVRINQRGPFVEGRIIDLSDDAFAELRPLSEGTVRVRIEW